MYLAAAGVGRLTLVDFDTRGPVQPATADRPPHRRHRPAWRPNRLAILAGAQPSVAVATLPQALDEAELWEQVRQADRWWMLATTRRLFGDQRRLCGGRLRAGQRRGDPAGRTVLVWRPGGRAPAIAASYRDADACPGNLAPRPVCWRRWSGSSAPFRRWRRSGVLTDSGDARRSAVAVGCQTDGMADAEGVRRDPACPVCGERRDRRRLIAHLRLAPHPEGAISVAATPPNSRWISRTERAAPGGDRDFLSAGRATSIPACID